MIWALLFALIFTGSDNVLMNPDFIKHVKKYVVDKERKQNILDMTTAFEKDGKAMAKKEKQKLSLKKHLIKLKRR